MPMQNFELEAYPSKGMNTALNPAQVPQGAQRRAFDAVMRTVNTIGKRDGSAPVTSSALANHLQHLTTYKSSASSVAPELFGAAGTTLYKFDGTDVLTAISGALNSADINTVAVTNASNESIMFIVDGGAVKKYDGTNVSAITPAADDAPSPPAPKNDLAAINAKGPKFCWVHARHVFLSAGTDLIWYSKRFQFDYFPETQFFRYVRDNDYITGPGVTFANICLIPMRRGWGVLTGEVFDDGEVANGFVGNQFLNTVNGNIAARGYTKITYPDGQQTIAYLSDDGVHEIFDTGFEGTGARQYSTRSLMKDKIDFQEFGFTEAEKKSAIAFFDAEGNRFLLSIERSGTYYTFAYDVRNQEWYLWRFPWRITAFQKWNDTLYFGSTSGHLHAFSDALYSDWEDRAKTVGPPVDFDVYSGLLSFEFTGERSYLHYYIMEAQQFLVPGSIDVYIISGGGMISFPNAFNTEIFIHGVSKWGEGVFANLNYTDIINNANYLIIHSPAKYFQRRWRNNRNEPVLILKERFEGTVSSVSGR